MLYGDNNWNVVALVDSNSVPVERYTYDAFGALHVYDASFNERTEALYKWTRTFTGQVLDPDTGLMLYRNRYYSSELGRFITRDPIGHEGDSISLYRYVGNRSIESWDLYGLYKTTPADDWWFEYAKKINVQEEYYKKLRNMFNNNCIGVVMVMLGYFDLDINLRYCYSNLEAANYVSNYTDTCYCGKQNNIFNQQSSPKIINIRFDNRDPETGMTEFQDVLKENSIPYYYNQETSIIRGVEYNLNNAFNAIFSNGYPVAPNIRGWNFDFALMLGNNLWIGANHMYDPSYPLDKQMVVYYWSQLEFDKHLEDTRIFTNSYYCVVCEKNWR